MVCASKFLSLDWRFLCLVLFLRHYTFKRTVLRAEDVEKGEPEEGNGDKHLEERTSEPTDNNEDDDARTAVDDVDEQVETEISWWLFDGHMSLRSFCVMELRRYLYYQCREVSYLQTPACQREVKEW